MLVADVDVVSWGLESDGVTPGGELGPRLLPGGVDVGSRASVEKV